MSTRAIAAIFLMALSISYASATELSVTLSNPGPIPLGDHQQITIAYAGVPEHAGLVVSVVPDIPESEFEKHGVYGGLLVLHPVPISGSGLHTIEWDTKNIGCAPTDMPMWCAALQIGRYRIKAEAFNASSFNLLGMFPGTTKPQSIFVAQSQSFTISGEPDLSPVIRNLDQAAFEFFAEAAGVPSLQIDQSGYLDTTGTLQTYYWTFCKLYKAKRPFSGEIRACMQIGRAHV